LKDKVDPIRILQVVTIMNLGGIETFLMTLYRNIDRDKIQFDFLVHRDEEGFFDDEIKNLGGKIIRMRPLNPLKIFFYKKELQNFFKKNSYQTVHSHLNANSSVILWIAKKAGIKNRIAHSHTSKTTSGMNGLFKAFNKIFINNSCNYRFSSSEEAGKWLFGFKKNFKTIKNSIKTSEFGFDSKSRVEMRKTLKLEDQTILIGNIGRFTYEKNHDFILEVFCEFNIRNNKSKLLLIGDGELNLEIKEKAKTLEVLDKIIFTGVVKNVAEYLNAMDVFIFPSLFEGLGIVAIEAQTNGLPVIINKELPKELDLTNLVYRISLKESIEIWVKTIAEAILENTPRSSKDAIVKFKGYDVHENSKYLQRFYLSLK
jgi:glycosyltransferase involved in cell wall biosynthesis